MGLPSYMLSVFDRNVVMRRVSVQPVISTSHVQYRHPYPTVYGTLTPVLSYETDTPAATKSEAALWSAPPASPQFIWQVYSSVNIPRVLPH